MNRNFKLLILSLASVLWLSCDNVKEPVDDGKTTDGYYEFPLNVHDEGFDAVFERVRSVLQTNKEAYRPQIVEMQNYIRVITDMSVELQGLEQSNKVLFDKFLHKKRNEIKDFNKSNKTAASYYQNMSNQHQSWQSYFLDKKK